MDLVSLQSLRTRALHNHMSSVPPRGLVGHKPSDIYPSLQLVPGDKVVDLDGPLGHALDHVNEGDLGPEGHQILAELLEDCLLHSTLYHM